jgi:ABC-type phosphate/phosphonate transport system substrate-binding protein
MSFTRRRRSCIAVAGAMTAGERAPIGAIRCRCFGSASLAANSYSAQDHACLKARTQQALSVPVELFASRDYSGLPKGCLPVAWIRRARRRQLRQHLPPGSGRGQPSSRSKSRTALGYRSVLLVRRQLSDPRRPARRTLAFTERLSTSGFLIYYELSLVASPPVL